LAWPRGVWLTGNLPAESPHLSSAGPFSKCRQFRCSCEETMTWRFSLPVFALVLLALVGCGSSDPTPAVGGAWTLALTPAAPSPGSPTPAGAVLTVNLNQDGHNLTGTVTAVNSPPSTCYPALSATGTTFTVTGQVRPPIEAGANLNLSISFNSTSSGGTFTAGGAVSGNMANGGYSLSAGAGSCSNGTFGMTHL
jgi:hypothetical protein